MPMKIESYDTHEAFVRFGISKNPASAGELYIGVKVPDKPFTYTAIDADIIPQLVAELMTYYIHSAPMRGVAEFSGHLNTRAIVKEVLVDDPNEDDF